MKDDNKTKKQLVDELTELHSQNAALKKSITGSISAELAAEESLRESEALFHSLIDYMQDAMIILNWDGSILFANRAAAKIIEFERPEEFVGHNMIEYLHPDSFQKAAEDLEAVKAGKMGFRSEYQLFSVTGRRIWVEDHFP
jgi:PAS domain S-box-containing protein